MHRFPRFCNDVESIHLLIRIIFEEKRNSKTKQNKEKLNSKWGKESNWTRFFVASGAVKMSMKSTQTQKHIDSMTTSFESTTQHQHEHHQKYTMNIHWVYEIRFYIYRYLHVYTQKERHYKHASGIWRKSCMNAAVCKTHIDTDVFVCVLAYVYWIWQIRNNSMAMFMCGEYKIE